MAAMMQIAKQNLSPYRTISKAAIGVPYYASELHKFRIIESAMMASIDCVKLVIEPKAALVGIDVMDPERDNFALETRSWTIFDLSVQRLSVTIFLHCAHTDSCGVGGHRNDFSVGGRLMDEALLDYCLKEHKKKGGRDLSQKVEFRRRLLVIVEAAK